MHRLQRALQESADDLFAIAGLGLIAFGLGQLPDPWGVVLAPVALGIGLLAAVAAGRR